MPTSSPSRVTPTFGSSPSSSVDRASASDTEASTWAWGRVPFATACGGDRDYGRCLAGMPRGFYGGIDNRVNATIPKTQALMKEVGKTYEPVTYEGAGHGFMRAGEEPGAMEANRKARSDAWERMKALLKKL